VVVVGDVLNSNSCISKPRRSKMKDQMRFLGVNSDINEMAEVIYANVSDNSRPLHEFDFSDFPPDFMSRGKPLWIHLVHNRVDRYFDNRSMLANFARLVRKLAELEKQLNALQAYTDSFFQAYQEQQDQLASEEAILARFKFYNEKKCWRFPVVTDNNMVIYQPATENDVKVISKNRQVTLFALFGKENVVRYPSDERTGVCFIEVTVSLPKLHPDVKIRQLSEQIAKLERQLYNR